MVVAMAFCFSILSMEIPARSSTDICNCSWRNLMVMNVGMLVVSEIDPRSGR